MHWSLDIKNSPGAINSYQDLSEFDYNEQLEVKAAEKVKIQRIYRRTYSTLPDEINTLKPNFIIFSSL